MALRALEAEVGLSCFLGAGQRLQGQLRSQKFPMDLQRHDVLRSGEVLHLSSLGTGTSSPSKPFHCAVYLRGSSSLQERLAQELQVPKAALRLGPRLRQPGVSVQLLSLPKGLPDKPPRETLTSGLLQDEDATLALGHTDLAEDGRSVAHRFSVVLRGLNPREAELLEDRVEEIRSNGFVNFFELALFGLAEVRHFEVGACLWAGRWSDACRLLLTANRRSSQLAPASQAFAQGDYERGLELLPSGCKGLRSLAMNLLLKRSAHEALVKSLGRADWSRYLGAVSRLAWNRAAALRLQSLPLKPQPGDLVFDEKAGEPRPVTAKEVHEERWQLRDLVLPLPRPSQAVPFSGGRLSMEAVLRELCPEEDAAPELFPLKLEQLLPKVRPLVAVPADFSWDLAEGDGIRVPCDLSRLQPSDPPTTGGRRNRREREGPALKLRATLGRTSSAEALIREVLKANPSEFQVALGRADETF
ncbi:unnamed protein product [Effrenium voratum]|nr:unnamed protein product [Effrenium voratum]